MQRHVGAVSEGHCQAGTQCSEHPRPLPHHEEAVVAIDEVRRTEAKEFKAAKQENVLEKGRWFLLKRPANLSEKQTSRLGDLMKLNLSSIKAYIL